MSDDLNEVLNRVAAGELSPAEAAELLDALAEPPNRESGEQWTTEQAEVPPAEEPAGATHQRGRQRGWSFDELVSDAVRKLMPNVGLDQLVAAHSVGVSVEYARQMKDLLGDITIGNLTGAKSTGVTVDYARQMRELAPDASLSQLIGAHSVGVSVEYVGAMRELFPETVFPHLIKAKAEGITPQQAAAYLERDPSLALRQIMKAVRAGVTPEQLDRPSGPKPTP